ncbi:MAG: hypothetical protein NZ455_14850, partial [Bacteroidia bacterium]|nr:hypothetical protein [Bacteroidia bacterium]MDW8347629.1 hypothetical protein [Bacteroidia bacterium]
FYTYITSINFFNLWGGRGGLSPCETPTRTRPKNPNYSALFALQKIALFVLLQTINSYGYVILLYEQNIDYMCK